MKRISWFRHLFSCSFCECSKSLRELFRKLFVFDVRKLFVSCPHVVRKLLTGCSQVVCKLRAGCSQGVRKLRAGCSQVVRGLFASCS